MKFDTAEEALSCAFWKSELGTRLPGWIYRRLLYHFSTRIEIPFYNAGEFHAQDYIDDLRAVGVEVSEYMIRQVFQDFCRASWVQALVGRITPDMMSRPATFPDEASRRLTNMYDRGFLARQYTAKPSSPFANSSVQQTQAAHDPNIDPSLTPATQIIGGGSTVDPNIDPSLGANLHLPYSYVPATSPNEIDMTGISRNNSGNVGSSDSENTKILTREVAAENDAFLEASADLRGADTPGQQSNNISAWADDLFVGRTTTGTSRTRVTNQITNSQSSSRATVTGQLAGAIPVRAEPFTGLGRPTRSSRSRSRSPSRRSNTTVYRNRDDEEDDDMYGPPNNSQYPDPSSVSFRNPFQPSPPRSNQSNSQHPDPSRTIINPFQQSAPRNYQPSPPRSAVQPSRPFQSSLVTIGRPQLSYTSDPNTLHAAPSTGPSQPGPYTFSSLLTADTTRRDIIASTTSAASNTTGPPSLPIPRRRQVRDPLSSSFLPKAPPGQVYVCLVCIPNVTENCTRKFRRQHKRDMQQHFQNVHPTLRWVFHIGIENI